MVAIYLSRVEELLDGLEAGQWPAAISPAQRARIERLARESDRRRTLAAEVLMRRVLSSHLGVSEGEIIVERNQFNKPFLPGADIFFNLSHSADRVACAVDTAPLGVDLEKIRPLPEMMGIVTRYFSAGEQLTLESCPEPDRLDCFFMLWTLKESFVKAAGKGLSIPLDSFSVRITGDGSAFLEDHPEESKWSLRSYSVGIHYRLALCAATSELPQGCSAALSRRRHGRGATDVKSKVVPAQRQRSLLLVCHLCLQWV